MAPTAAAEGSPGAADRSPGAAEGSPGAAGGSPGPATASEAARLAQAQATHEYPSPPPPPETAADAATNPVQAVRDFATAYINWTALSVASDMRALATESIGQARSAMELAAAQTANDYELQRGGIANSGTVEAIAPLLGHPGQYVVVSREATTATNTTAYAGLSPAWHLAIATVVRLQPGGWALSGWRPEN